MLPFCRATGNIIIIISSCQLTAIALSVQFKENHQKKFIHKCDFDSFTYIMEKLEVYKVKMCIFKVPRI